MLLAALTYVLAGLVLLLGWKQGGTPERCAVLAIVAWLAVDPLYRLVFETPEFDRIDWALFVFDLALAGALTVIALHANRIWPMFAAAFSIIPVLCPFALLVNETVVRQAYWALEQLPLMFVLMALLIGTSAHRERMAAGIACEDWSI